MPDIEQPHRTAYGAGADPIDWAATMVAQQFGVRDEIRAGRAADPGAFPGYRLDLDALSAARRALAVLLDAGWTPPTTAHQEGPR